MHKTKDLTLNGMIIAIIALMTYVPQLGYITINLVNVTLIHIPVLIASLTFKKWNMALVAGTAFGVSSWFNALTRPTSPISVLFQNPMVSILPRIAFALLAFYLFKFLFSKTKNEYASQIITIFIAVLFHTISVITMVYIFGSKLFEDGFLLLLKTVVLSNGIFELIIALLIVPVIVKVLKKQVYRG